MVDDPPLDWRRPYGARFENDIVKVEALLRKVCDDGFKDEGENAPLETTNVEPTSSVERTPTFIFLYCSAR